MGMTVGGCAAARIQTNVHVVAARQQSGACRKVANYPSARTSEQARTNAFVVVVARVREILRSTTQMFCDTQAHPKGRNKS